MSVWTGLGITSGQPYQGWGTYIANPSLYNAPVLPLITSKFSRIRVITNYNSDTLPHVDAQAKRLWVQAVKAYSPSTYIMYGGTGGSILFGPQNYANYLLFIQTEAAFAQANSIDIFCIGNEFEGSANRAFVTIATLSGNGTTATATFSSNHGFTTGNYITVKNASISGLNIADSPTVPSTTQCTVVNSTTITYPSSGNGTSTGTPQITWGFTTLAAKIKSVAVAVKPYYTGPLVYSCSQGYNQYWYTAGITPGTDLDLIAFNEYGTGSNEASFSSWKTDIDAIWSTFGTDAIITEVNLNAAWGASTINNFTPSKRGFEAAWDDEMVRRIQYIQNKGFAQAYIYVAYQGDNEFSLLYDSNTNNAAAITQPPGSLSSIAGALIAIGATQNPAIESFNGEMDEIAIGAYAPSWNDVLAMYTESLYSSLWTHLKLDEGSGTTAVDSSGNGNNGSITAATYLTDPVLGITSRNTAGVRISSMLSALQFAYTQSNTLWVANNAVLQSFTSLTVEMFLRIDCKVSFSPKVLNFLSGSNGFQVQISAGQRLAFTVGNGTSTAFITTGSTTLPPIGVFAHVAFIWDGSQLPAYVSGIGTAPSSLSGGSTGNPGMNLFIGNGGLNATGGNASPPITISEVRISKTVRYSGNFSVPIAPFPNDANTIALWHLTNGSGTSAADSSGNGITGTLSASASNPLPSWVAGYFSGAVSARSSV